MNGALILTAVLSLSAAPPAQETSSAQGGGVTSADLVAKCAQAMGGREKIDALKTLRVQAVYPDHGEHPLGFEIKRPDLSYSPQAEIAFDGKRACWLKGQDRKSEPELVNPKEIVDFYVEIALFFPAFFDYPSEYAGSEIVDGRPAQKLRVRLPREAVLVYFLDAETGLPLKVNSRFAIGGKSFDSDRVYSDYRSVGGILYPHGFTYRGRDGGIKNARITSVEFNVPFDHAHFTIPAEAKE